MIRKESKGNGNRQTLEEIVRGDEAKQAASDGGDGDDDPDPYADKSASGSWQVTTYIYDVTAPYYEVLAETTNGKTTAYDYGVERLAAHTASFWGSSKTEYVYDGRGSVAQEIGYNNSWYTFKGVLSKKNVVSKSYSPFGEQLGVAMSGYGFNGEYYDSATGMLNLRARQYEPATMRFGQRDLLKGDASEPLSLNRYLYCTNDPVNFADFDGQSLKSLWNKAKSVAKSAVKAVAKTVTNTAARVVSAVVTAAKNTVSAAKAVYNTAKTIVNTVKSVSNATKNGNTTKAIGSIMSGGAQVYNNYVEARSEIQATNASAAEFVQNVKDNPASALENYVAQTFGQLSAEKQQVLNLAINNMRKMQADGANEQEIAREFLKACRAVGGYALETSVTEIREEIVKPTMDAVRDEVLGLKIGTQTAYGGLSKYDYLHTDTQDINMFYANGSMAGIKDKEGKMILPTGVLGESGVAAVSANAFGTNQYGNTGGLNIEALNASAGIGYLPGKLLGLDISGTVFKVGGFLRNDEKTLVEANVGLALKAKLNLEEKNPIEIAPLLDIDLVINGLKIL